MYVNFRLGFPTLAYMFRCRLFLLLIEQHIRVLYFLFVVLGTQWPWSFYTGFWNFLFLTNLQYFHCVYIDFNTVNLMYSIILYKCTLCNLITSAKTIACLSIYIEGYFWYFVTMTACIVSAYILLKGNFCIWCHIDLGHLSELHHFYELI